MLQSIHDAAYDIDTFDEDADFIIDLNGNSLAPPPDERQPGAVSNVNQARSVSLPAVPGMARVICAHCQDTFLVSNNGIYVIKLLAPSTYTGLTIRSGQTSR